MLEPADLLQLDALSGESAKQNALVDDNYRGQLTTTMLAGYGYFIWTENSIVPNTAWASGWGGQRIGWHKDSDRMVVVFSNAESWMGDVYEVARDWNRISK